MRSLRGIGPLIWGRLAATWRLQAVLAFGILAAATLLAVSPAYTRVMNDAGLRHSLEETSDGVTRTSAIDFDLALGSEEAAAEMEGIARLMDEDISWFSTSGLRYGKLIDLAITPEGSDIFRGTTRTHASVQTLSGFEDRVELVAGRLPRPTDDPAQLEGVVTREGAIYSGRNYPGASPGDRFLISYDDCDLESQPVDFAEAAQGFNSPCLPQAFAFEAIVTVVGVVDRADSDDPYWTAGGIDFTRIFPPDARTGATLPLLLPEESLFEALPKALPGVPYEFHLSGFADLGRLNSANLDDVRASLASLGDRLEERGTVGIFTLDRALASFEVRASFNQVTLLLLLLQVVGIAIFYVLLVASLLAERRAEEIAMLRSRGATVGQIVAMSAAEAAWLGLGAALVAPFLASGAVAALGKTGTFESVSGGDFLAYTLVPQSFLFAAGGAALAVVAVIVPAFFAARRGMVVYLRGAARPEAPLLQRYNLDLGIVGLAGFALWQLNQRESVFDPRGVGGWSADPLLLLSPLLLILAVGVLVFRFLPLLLGLIGRLVNLTAGPGVALSLWELTRRPARYSQLTLLVVMAAAVGTFAATYGETTDRSQEQRARFGAGVDIRAQGAGDLRYASRDEVKATLAAIPGVTDAATATRVELPMGPLRGFGPRIEVLGVDPAAIRGAEGPNFPWFREDFADEDLTILLRPIVDSQAGGGAIVLDGGPTAISAQVNPTIPRSNSNLWVRTVDANGIYRLHELGPIDFTGYRRLEAVIDARVGIEFPISVLGLLVTQVRNTSDPPEGSLLVDDLAATIGGVEVVVEDFEGAFRWNVIGTPTRDQDTVERIDQGTYRGNGAARFAFETGVSNEVRGIYLADPKLPVRAIVSQRFLDQTRSRIGSRFNLVLGSVTVPMQVQGSARLFPTLSDGGGGFAIVNQEHLFFYAGLTLQRSLSGPTEVWLNTEPEARPQVLETLAADFGILEGAIIDVEAVLEEVRSDPIVRAGGSGVLLIALVAAFTILALGFGFTLYIGGQGRTIEVSVLRAVGLSPRQVFAMISLEYLLVAAIGFAVGTLAGLLISQTMLSFLEVTEQGGRILPPFELATSWDTVVIAYAATAVAFVAGIVGLVLYFLRLPVSRVLRLTR